MDFRKNGCPNCEEIMQVRVASHGTGVVLFTLP